MTTSLAAQLQRLAIPQTNVLVDAKKKASLLFDPSEAAKLSKEAVFEIGREGLAELIEIDINFQPFETSLFRHDTQFIERAVESKEVNKKLDKTIKRFMLRLSPYLLLKSAHKALEWLIHRYHIHFCNVSDLFGLIMPYHKTNIFVKLLQIADVKSSVFQYWAWLQPYQKEGLQIPNSAIVNHAISDTSFLRFICDYTERNLKEHKKTGSESKIKTQLAFYMKTVSGVLRSGPANDEILAIILPSIFNGLLSHVADFRASAYIIVCNLFLNNQLQEHLSSKILHMLMEDGLSLHEQQRSGLVLLFFQYQQTIPPINFESFKDLDWLVDDIARFTTLPLVVGKFLEVAVKSCLDHIFSKSPLYAVEAQVMCWKLLEKIKCEDSALPSLFNLLTSYSDKPSKSSKKVKLSSDVENNAAVANWLKTLIEHFMAKYDIALAHNKSREVQKLRQQWLGEKVDEATDAEVASLVRKCAAGNINWPLLKPMLLKHIDNVKIHKAWYQVAPCDEPLNLLLVLENILRPNVNVMVATCFVAMVKRHHKHNNEFISALNLVIRDPLESQYTVTDAVDAMMATWLEQRNPYGFLNWMRAIKELASLGTVPPFHTVWLYAFKMLFALLPTQVESSETLQVVESLLNVSMIAPQYHQKVCSDLLDKVITMPDLNGGWCDLSTFEYPVYLRLKTLEVISLCVLTKSKAARKSEDLLKRLFKSFDSKAMRGFLWAVCGGLPQFPCFPDNLVAPVSQMGVISYFIGSVETVSSQEMDQAICHLFMAMSSSSKVTRSFALTLLKSTLEKSKDEKYRTLMNQLLLRSEEIESDPDQLSVALYCLLSPEASVQESLDPTISGPLAKDRESLAAVLNSPDVPLYVAAKILVLMESVTSDKILKDLVTVARRAMDCKTNMVVSNIALASYWHRLNVTTVAALDEPEVWRLVEDSLAHHKCDSLCPALVFLKVVKKELFAALTQKQQEKLLEALVKTRSESESSSVSAEVATVCRKIVLQGQVILHLLDKLVAGFPRDTSTPPTALLESKPWRFVIALLELIQNKKKMRESRVLLRSLFDVLKFCLDQEEQTTFEYAKQLVLSCLLEICGRHNAGSETIETSVLNVELVIHCLRASWNPQTHHHALLLLSCLASIIPVQVMHNMMAIFTFMGSSVARLDDEHSVQVVAKVVDAVVPVLVQNLESSETGGDAVVAEVLRIFVWTLKDVPIHRRTPLFTRLITTLDPDRSLWIFLLLLFENYVLSAYRADKNYEGNMPPSLQLGMELSLSFGPKVVLNTTLKLIHYLIQIPIDKMNPSQSIAMADEDNEVSPDGLFDIAKHTPKQLRHYAYTLVTFINTMLADQNLILQVRELDATDSESVGAINKDAIAALLLYTPLCATQQLVQLAKFWKSMYNIGVDVLDRLVTLVSSETLVSIISKLLEHSSESLRRKALDLLNVHIQNHRSGFTSEEKSSLAKLVDPILVLAIETPEASDNTQASVDTQAAELIQQTACLSLRLLAKALASDYTDLFKQVLEKVSKLCKSKGNLLASAVLTVADLVAYLKIRAVSELSNFLPPILKAFHKYITAESTDLILMSLSAALYRIVEFLALFLSPYMDKLLYSVCCLATKWPEAGDVNRKLHQIRQKLAINVPNRVLIPSLGRCYTLLIEEKKMAEVGPLLSVLADSLSNYNEVSKLLPELTPFFIQVLQIRSDAAEGKVEASDEEVFLVETFGIDAFVPLVLKLSELSFKPLYYQIYYWCSNNPHRAITFYRLSCKLAEGLKGLFVLFSGHFMVHAAELLESLNVSKGKEPFFGEGEAAEKKAILLLESIIQTLYTVFLFDSSNSLGKDKFQALLQPLVDQLDNTLGGPEKLEERSNRLLIPCLAQMTLATDDLQWKALNYQLLTKTRSPSPLVRIAALKTVVEVAAKLHEDYLPLLPETIGSLAELLEDEDERVEEAMKEALRRMEDDLGQPIREYFQ